MCEAGSDASFTFFPTVPAQVFPLLRLFCSMGGNQHLGSIVTDGARGLALAGGGERWETPGPCSSWLYALIGLAAISLNLQFPGI